MHHLAGLIAIVLATIVAACAQSVAGDPTVTPMQPAPSRPSHEWNAGFRSLASAPKSQTLAADYRPITPHEDLRWFIASTVGAPHLAGAAFMSALGTALDRPPEYGPHWEGFADRFGMGMPGAFTGNAMEAGAGLLLRQDPRYFRAPGLPLKARAGNILRLTFGARGQGGGVGPAYARYVAIVGSNFLSNTWRDSSQANAQSALLRSLQGFAGRLAGNALTEFWPDITKHVFRKSKDASQRKSPGKPS